jgi:23S rRNA (cytosine1962-C5)-methyltransferase
VSGVVMLKKKGVKPVQRHHPWVFSGAIASVEGLVGDGDIVDVCDSGRNWMARGYINRRSQIAVRILTWNRGESINPGFWRRRVEQAVSSRNRLGFDSVTSACRLVHAESDYLPGLVVDKYGDWLVLQILTLGVERHKKDITTALADTLKPRGIYERSDVEVRRQEGLGLTQGHLMGDEPPDLLEISENGIRFLVDVRSGHKTGYYLDQRENRARFEAYCSGAQVLDVFSYTGSFAVGAARGGASGVTLVESSAPMLGLAKRHLTINGLESVPAEHIEGNVFSVLRGFRAAGNQYDCIAVDPPKLASTSRDVKQASRAYKDVNLLAFQLLRPGGVLFSTSCSGAVSADLFQKIVFGALIDAGRDGQIVGRLAQGTDHPVALTYPEGAYLKGLIVRVV